MTALRYMGTHHKGTKEEVLALDTYIKLMRAANSVLANTNSHLEAEQITISQFGVLEAVHHLGPLHLSVLAEKLLKTGGNLTLVVSNLEKMKLVKRRQERSDRRYVSVHLTPKGEALVVRVFKEHLQYMVRVMNTITPEEQVELARLCKKLGKGAPANAKK